MINRLLITLLHRNKRLVIPTLGAFIRKKIEGVGVVLVFVPFLKKDDENVLLKGIKTWAGVEDDDALEIMKEYIAAIKLSLEQRGQYIIEDIGVLKFDVNNILYLAKESEANIAPLSRPQPQPIVASVEPLEVAQLPEEIGESDDESEDAEIEEFPYDSDLLDDSLEAEKSLEEEQTNENEASIEPEQDSFEEEKEAIVDEVDDVEGDEVEELGYEKSEEEDVEQEEEPKAPVVERNYNTQPSYGTKQSIGDLYSSYRGKGAKPEGQAGDSSKPSQERKETVSLNSGVGARYFTPQKNKEADSERRATLNTIYGNSAEPKPAPAPQQPAAKVSGERVSQLYNTTSQSQQPKQSANSAPKSTTERLYGASASEKKVVSSQRGRQTKKSKGKNNDIVLWIAILAVVVTVGVLVYGFVYGGETTLAPQIEIESVEAAN